MLKGKDRRDIVDDPPGEAAHRLHLALTREVRLFLREIKAASEAESYGEVVRRALMALETFPIEGIVFDDEVPLPASSGNAESLQIYLPARSMQRLEELKAKMLLEKGRGSYAEVIREALMVFAQFLYEMGKLKPERPHEKGGNVHERIVYAM